MKSDNPSPDKTLNAAVRLKVRAQQSAYVNNRARRKHRPQLNRL